MADEENIDFYGYYRWCGANRYRRFVYVESAATDKIRDGFSTILSNQSANIPSANISIRKIHSQSPPTTAHIIPAIFSGFLRLFFNFIPTPPYCFYIFRLFHTIPHFFTKMADMHRNCIVAFTVIRIPPDLMKQILSTDNTASFLA